MIELDLGFPEVDPAEWRRRVEAELSGAGLASLSSTTPDGLEVRPLYTAADGEPDPQVRACLGDRSPGWRRAATVSASDPEAARGAVRRLVDQGVEELWVRWADRSPVGEEPSGGEGGVTAATVEEAAALLDPIDPARHRLVIEGGAAALPAAALALAAFEARGVCASELRGSFGWDPLSTLATRGRLPGSLEEAFAHAAGVASWALREAPGLRTALVSTVAYREAGATAVEELAFGLASGVEVLRRLADGGLAVADAAGQLHFATGVDRDVFLEVAKLRAARLLWAKVGAAVGFDGGMAFHARCSRHAWSALDPTGNLLRATAGVLAAALGGADSIAVPPHDSALGDSPEGSRLALNVQHLLADEGRLGEIVDPAGGSWTVEALTDGLARAAWALFQEIETGGGMVAAIVDGRVAERVMRSAEARRRALTSRRELLVGVTDFVALDDDGAADGEDNGVGVGKAERRAVAVEGFAGLLAAAREGAPLPALSAALWRGEPAAARRLETRRLAAPFEALRRRSEQQRRRQGRPPRAFLVQLQGDGEGHRRGDLAARLLAVGGIEAAGGEAVAGVDGAAAAFRRSGAESAILCAGGEALTAAGDGLAARLREVGARRVGWLSLAGDDPALLEASGAEIRLGEGDLVAALDRLLSTGGGRGRGEGIG